MTNPVKYPRTLHLPWSEGISSDDKVLTDTSCFEGKVVIVSEKMDGENTTLYRDHIHARSLDSGDHWSRHWIKGFWSAVKNEIPVGWRICGENLYATHSIYYDDLNSYFQMFSAWDENNICLSYKDTNDLFAGIFAIPRPIWIGPYNEQYLKDLATSDWSNSEGYVVRVADAFHFDDFQTSVAKFVRKGHVQTNEHWMYSGNKKINRLAGA